MMVLVDLIRGMQLGAVDGREAHIGEHVGLGFVQQGGQLWHFGADLIGDVTPLLACSLGVVLGESGGDEGGDHPPALLAGMGKDVAHKMDAGVVEKGTRDEGLCGDWPVVMRGEHLRARARPGGRYKGYERKFSSL